MFLTGYSVELRNLLEMKPAPAPLTHFICLPLRSVDFRKRVIHFNSRLNSLLPNTIPPSIIRPTGSLHFTLGVLSLTTPDEIESAVTFLQTCRDEAVEATDGGKLTVRVKGITSMQTNIKKTSVIYAVPEEGDGRLRLLASIVSPFNRIWSLDLLQGKFKDAGFLKHDRHSANQVRVCACEEISNCSCIVRYWIHRIWSLDQRIGTKLW